MAEQIMKNVCIWYNVGFAFNFLHRYLYSYALVLCSSSTSAPNYRIWLNHSVFHTIALLQNGNNFKSTSAGIEVLGWKT